MILLGRLTFLLVFGLSLVTIDCGFAPSLPTGRRTQYYYRYEDGGYKHGYDTGDGSYAKAIASPDNEVQGDFAYQGPGGKVDVKYTAGKGGFVPDGLPAHGGAQLHSGQIHGGQIQSAHLHSGAYSPSLHNVHHASVYTASDHDGSSLVEEPSSGDASYSFAYNVGDQARHEVSDAQGNIQGSYTYIANDGSSRKVDYEAGAKKGFLVKGDVPTAVTGDGSYAFSYSAGDHARHESADSSGNVVGGFSFISKDDGLNRQVDYEAGAERGFIARGNHLPQPVPQQVPQTSYISSDHHNAVVTDSARIRSGYAGHHLAHAAHSAGTHSLGAHNTWSGNYNTIGDGSVSAPGRAYQFSYNAGDHTRHESSDANGNVVGGFSFVAKDDKLNRNVDYIATADKGFVAFGSHLPVPPVDTNAAVHHAYSGFNQPHLHHSVTPYQHSYVQTPIAHQRHYSTGIAQQHSTGVAPDGSYSITYDAGDHTRTETADGHGNVVGSFTFIAKDDGLQRRVDYEAGGKGFIAAGNHLPLQPHVADPSILVAKQGNVHSSDYDDGSYRDSGDDGSYREKSIHDGSYTDTSGGHRDASYSFAYNAGDHTRQESSDAFGNVIGSFSFIAKDDGLNRQVDYEAGAGKGFIARGNHLPVPPSSEAGSPFAYSAGVHSTPAHFSGTSHGIHGSHDGSYYHNAAGGHTAGTYLASSGITKSYTDSNALVKTFLTPNPHHKFGYIYDTQ